jgi:hypothetical protein
MRALLPVVALCAASTCIAADDVQRQLLQREQSQTELRLKMQQQQERALRPPQSPSSDFQQRTLDRDQQQRFQQLQERETREALAPAAPDDLHREVERQRAPQATAEELKRLERERNVEHERELSAERNRVGQ